MATYEQAERARDELARRLLDGVRVISIGIRRAGTGYGVGITATRDLTVPALAAPLNKVHVAVRVTEGKGRRQSA